MKYVSGWRLGVRKNLLVIQSKMTATVEKLLSGLLVRFVTFTRSKQTVIHLTLDDYDLMIGSMGELTDDGVHSYSCIRIVSENIDIRAKLHIPREEAAELSSKIHELLVEYGVADA